MEYISDDEIPVKQKEEHLFRLLDRGVDDMEAGRELPNRCSLSKSR